MKKHILSFALVATMVGSIAAGCSSTKSTDGSDSTKTDSTATVTPAATDSTSSKTDTTKQDTTKKPM
ncbi:MAG: coproporphyrinogen III oxidase [Bacteroidota bacterium]